MRYMMFIRHGEDFTLADVPQSLFGAMGEFIDAATKDGSIVDTAGLKPTKEGKRVRLAGGQLSVVDGPFTETKEVVGGYALIEAKSLDDAMAIATKFMEIHRVHWPKFQGSCEVRALDTGEAPPA
jgi:hypothetical protein